MYMYMLTVGAIEGQSPPQKPTCICSIIATIILTIQVQYCHRDVFMEDDSILIKLYGWDKAQFGRPISLVGNSILSKYNRKIIVGGITVGDHQVSTVTGWKMIHNSNIFSA